MLIYKWERIVLKHLNDSADFIEYSNGLDDIYKNIEEYKPKEKHKTLIIFDDMIADLLKHNPVITELLIKARKLNISLVFITQRYFVIPKNIRLNLRNALLWKFQTKESFNKLHLIIHHILSLRFVESLQKMRYKAI